MADEFGKANDEEGGKPVDVLLQCPLGPIIYDKQPKELLTEFKNLYEGRIKRIDRENGDKPELKIAALEEWVKDLTEQNAVLIDVASELERESHKRVALLESRLKCSARATRESMLRIQDFEAKTWEASAERVKAQTCSLKTKSDLLLLEQEQIKLKEEVAGLRCDISTLLQFIRRGRKTDNWNFSDLALNEVSQEELQCAFKGIVRETQAGGEGEMFDEDSRASEITKLNTALMQEIIEKDSIIARLEGEVTHLSHELSLSESAHTIDKLGAFLSESNESSVCHMRVQLERSREENEKKSFVIVSLKEGLVDAKKRIAELQRHISDLEKASRETRDVLTNEVAAKHDQVLVLRGELGKLEEALHQACVQARFKDDIVKEMRQEIRSSRAKVASLESEIQNRTLECGDRGVGSFHLSQTADYSHMSGGQDYSQHSSRKHST
ncbi:early endosome antigen 1-like [Hetaerina americana]|uniref:early endosome antigen 1-like n=1 Tax=Hetaerina americana TaxID=62018 RepID=UPI003A7F334A